MGSYSVVQRDRRLFDGPAFLLFSYPHWCVEKKAMVMAPPPVHDSAVSPCFHGCWAFLHRHFPAQSSPSHSLEPSLHSQQQPSPWIAPQSPNSSSQPLHPPGYLCSCPGYVWMQQGLSLIPFRLPQISCFTLSLKCFSSDSDNCPDVGIRPLLQFPHPLRAGPVLLTLLFFPLVPLSYRVFAWFYIFFSAGQLLLSTLSWCSACTSVSEGVFLMYQWREMYSISTYSSIILFFLMIHFFSV